MEVRYRKGSQEKELVVVVPRKLGKAVVRNRIRRRTREAFRLEGFALPPGTYLVRPFADVFEAPFGDLKRDVQGLRRRIEEEKV